MNHNLSKQKRGRSSLNRLGVATLSGLLAAGLTPALTTPAFASGEAVTPSADNPSSATITAETAVTLNGGKWGDKLFKAHFTKVAKTDSNKVDEKCPDAPADVAFTHSTSPDKYQAKATLDVSKISAENNTCIYEVTQIAGEEPNEIAWPVDKDKKFTVTFKKTNSGTTADVAPANSAFANAYNQTVTFDAGEGGKVGDEEGATQTKVVKTAGNDLKDTANGVVTPKEGAKAKHLYGWQLTATAEGSTNTNNKGKIYRFDNNVLKEVEAAGTLSSSSGATYTAADGDVLTAVWGYEVTFAAATKDTDPQKKVLVKENGTVAQNNLPQNNQCGSGAVATFKGWQQTAPDKVESILAEAEVTALQVAEDKTLAPVCEAPTTKAKIKVGDQEFTPILGLDGKITKEALDKNNQKVDFTKACGETKSLNPKWTKKTPPSGSDPVGDLFTENNVKDAVEGTVYVGTCDDPAITVKGENGDKIQTNEGDFPLDTANGKTVKIILGADAKYNHGEEGSDDTVTLPTLKRADNHADDVLVGWKVGNDPDAKTYKADLSGLLTVPANGKDGKYLPKHGDTLTAVWGYKVTYQKNDGSEIGQEYVAKANVAAKADFKVGGKDVHTLKLCSQGLPTGDWYTGKDFKTKVNTELTDMQKSVVVRAECNNKGIVNVKFDATKGEFADGIANTNTDTLDGKVLTRQGFALKLFKGPVVDDFKPLAGFEFKGWSTDKDATTSSPVTTAPAKDTTYYAVWVKHDPVHVTYYKSDGATKIKFGGDPDAKEYVEVKYNDPNWTVINGKNEYCTSGLNFQYWVGKDTLLLVGAEPEKYSPVPLVANLDGLKAYCSAKPATPMVTFDAGKGTIKSEFRNPAEIKEGAVTAPTPDQVEAPEGKAFSKWCEAPAGGQELTAETCKDPELTGLTGDKAKAKTVYALYVDSFKVTFDLKGGTPAEGENTEKWSDKDGKVTAPKFTAPTDKVFTKWCEKPAAGEAKPDCAEVKLAELTVTKPMNLEAVYKTAVTVKLQSDKGEDVNAAFSVADDTLAKDVPAPENAGDYCKADAAKTVFDKWVMADGKDFAADAKVSKDLVLKAQCKAPVVEHTVKVTVGTETKEIKVVDGQKLTVDQLKTAGVTCGEGQALKLTKADGTVFSLDTAISEAIELTAKCEAKSTPGGSGGSTGGSSSGGSYFGGGSGGSSSPSTPAKDKKPGDKKPGDKKPGAKQPVVNKFDKQFTKKVELPKSAVKRAAGADRVATSVAALSLAKNHEVVVLATGSNFPDALVGGALAGAYKAGVVLTTGATLEQSVLDSLKSYKTKTVHIIGGNGAVSLAKEAQLRAAGLQVVRHAGADRYATAQAVKAATLKALGGKSAISCNATGSNFPDALACSSAASQMGGVVDLVKPGTAVAKDATAKTVCAGGPACQAAGAGVDKVVGSDRYETAYKLAEMTPAKGSVLVSNGQSYADSLVAGALAGSLQADLVLAKPTRVNVPADTKNMQLFGGKTVLPDTMAVFTK